MTTTKYKQSILYHYEPLWPVIITPVQIPLSLLLWVSTSVQVTHKYFSLNFSNNWGRMGFFFIIRGRMVLKKGTMVMVLVMAIVINGGVAGGTGVEMNPCNQECFEKCGGDHECYIRCCTEICIICDDAYFDSLAQFYKSKWYITT